MTIELGQTPNATAPADRKAAGQQRNVYAAECRIDHGRLFATVEAAQSFVDSLTAADWWFAQWVVRVEVFTLQSTKWAGCARPRHEHNAGQIHLTDSGRNELTILHEVAHAIAPEGSGHGPTWVQTYMKLVYHALGSDRYKQLYDSFQDHGVLFD